MESRIDEGKKNVKENRVEAHVSILYFVTKWKQISKQFFSIRWKFFFSSSRCVDPFMLPPCIQRCQRKSKDKAHKKVKLFCFHICLVRAKSFCFYFDCNVYFNKTTNLYDFLCVKKKLRAFREKKSGQTNYLYFKTELKEAESWLQKIEVSFYHLITLSKYSLHCKSQKKNRSAASFSVKVKRLS